jgi:hypothetical protein
VRRRSFIGAAGATLLAGLPLPGRTTPASQDAELRPDLVYNQRVAAAAAARAEYLASHGNGDLERYASSGYIGNFAKGLPHEPSGVVTTDAYESMIRALEFRDPMLLDFSASPALRRIVAEAVQPGGELAACDYTGFFVPAAPAVASARTAADITELYWLALTRDIPFADFDEDPLIAKACKDLTRLVDFETPRVNGAITPQTVFRGPGRTTTGPYLSQFFWLDVPIELGGPSSQRRTMPIRRDSLTDRTSWFSAQTGGIVAELTPRDGSRRYMQTGRDLTDYLWQLNSAVAWRNAAAIIAALPDEARTETFNFDDIVGMIAFASGVSGDAMFYQKMYIQRRVRPEALCSFVDNGPKNSPLHPDIWTTPVLDLVQARFSSRLLPQAYLEGCPTHPAYPAGHGTLAGTGVTVLKSQVNEAYVLPAPMVPSRDGTRLEPYTGPPLTLGGELDKLAANCALGRDTAGVHYRSDSYAGLRLGEAAVLSFMRDRVTAIGAGASTYSLTSIDGAKITVSPGSIKRVPSTTRSS